MLTVVGMKGFFLRKEESSFCEQKEAKKLYPLAPGSLRGDGCQWGKVFWFFFSKKNCLLTSP
jgi:hypothetical protein